jgi:hypothetical protein
LEAIVDLSSLGSEADDGRLFSDLEDASDGLEEEVSVFDG